MKNLFISTVILFCFFPKAQIAIGKASITNSSCLLEFGTATKGILLPTVSDATATTSVAGTLLFDATTGGIRYYGGTTPAWSTAIAGGTTGGAPTGTDKNTKGALIGASTSSANGILILESPSKALVLPIVSQPAARFSTPPKGLMVFDSSVNQVAVYNGSKWTYF